MTEDGVRLDEPADLLEFRLTDGEMSWLIDGAAPIEGSPDGLVRVRVGRWSEPRHRSPEGAFADSSLEVLIPELDLASDTTHDVRIEFFTGTSPLLLISGETTIPRPTLHFLIDAAVGVLHGVDWREGRYLNLADRIEFVGIRILNTRITEVERTVREALGDSDFSDDDLEALQAYPDRLAAVESAARSLRGKWPDAKSAMPSSGRFPIVHLDRPADHYGEYVDGAEQAAKDSVARLSGLISSQQIVLTQHQAQETRRFQRVVTIVGATVLVPGLVAAVFGADVGFHGRDTTAAFWAMLLLMAGGALVTYALIRSFEAGAWRAVRGSAAGEWLASKLPVARLVILAVLGIVLLVVGAAVLLGAPASSKGPPTDDTTTGATSGRDATSTQAEKSDRSSAQTKPPSTSSAGLAEEGPPNKAPPP